MMSSILFRLTRFNRNSLASLLGYLKPLLSRELQLTVAVSAAAAQRLFARRPDFAAYSFTTWQARACALEIRQLKNAWPKTLFLAGGPHPSGDPEGTLRMGFDYVFVGEGEISLAEFLCRSARPPRGSIINTSSRLVDLDAIDTFLPEYGLTPPLEITRGCPHGCAFCQTPVLFSPIVRHRSVEGIEQWRQKMLKNGLRQLRFITPNAFGYGSCGSQKLSVPSIDRLLSRCSQGQARVYFGSFPSEVRPESCLPEIVRLVRKYCHNRRVVLGAQSGSDRMLKVMRRGHNTSDIFKAARILHAHDCIPVVDFIFGLPAEEVQDRAASRRLIAALVNDCAAVIRGHVFLPLPGSRWAEEKPGNLDDATRALLIQLQAQSAAEGYWEAQNNFNAQTADSPV
ncbi:TIGR04013 family B12-binding domain/radical SAM domain-containing protein [candidate division FCPU426 bacterium]|nr:TIGR04013 family B12-binding domain/radical SAM domain-containing protein [candidate division FCPU426 bacterium]